jgi:hypothetical protein
MKGLSSFKNEINTEIDRINRMREADKQVRANYKNTKDMTEQ